MPSVEEFRQKLDASTLEMVDALRTIIYRSHCDLEEGIKWNAPSFSINNRDRITLGIDPKGGVRVVLHRDAKVNDIGDFKFEDVDRLARWPAPDRGVISFKCAAEINQVRSTLEALFRRWIEATT